MKSSLEGGKEEFKVRTAGFKRGQVPNTESGDRATFSREAFEMVRNPQGRGVIMKGGKVRLS